MTFCVLIRYLHSRVFASIKAIKIKVLADFLVRQVDFSACKSKTGLYQAVRRENMNRKNRPDPLMSGAIREFLLQMTCFFYFSFDILIRWLFLFWS